MRIYLRLTPNTKPVPFDYQLSLVGAFHKWLGGNTIHDGISLYSLSWLSGGKIKNNALDFPDGTVWQISAYDDHILKKVVDGIMSDPAISFGLSVKEIVIQKTPVFRNREYFYVKSPVFIKRNIGERIKFYLFNDQESSSLMTETLKNKLRNAGLDDSGVAVKFDDNYSFPKTKKITFNGIDCRSSICPIIVSGTPEQVGFAWNVGIGNSTGIGFGALK